MNPCLWETAALFVGKAVDQQLDLAPGSNFTSNHRHDYILFENNKNRPQT